MFLFLVTSYLVVAVQPCMEWIPINNNNNNTIFSGDGQVLEILSQHNVATFWNEKLWCGTLFLNNKYEIENFQNKPSLAIGALRTKTMQKLPLFSFYIGKNRKNFSIILRTGRASPSPPSFLGYKPAGPNNLPHKTNCQVSTNFQKWIKNST